MTIYGNASTVAEARMNAVRYPHNSHPIVAEYLDVQGSNAAGMVWVTYVATLSNDDTFRAVLTDQPVRLIRTVGFRAEMRGDEPIVARLA